MTTCEYLRVLRKKQNLTKRQICSGLCTVEEFKDYEKGSRKLDFFVRVRLMGRLGVSRDGTQYMLSDSSTVLL